MAVCSLVLCMDMYIHLNICTVTLSDVNICPIIFITIIIRIIVKANVTLHRNEFLLF